jgi:hypothetical protein
MFFQRPPRNGLGFGNSFNTNPFGNSLVAETRPQPRPQTVMMNSGYPVLDLIAGLGEVFTRPMHTPPTFPPNNSMSGSWGADLPDYGSDELQFPDRRLPQPPKPGEPYISKLPWPPKTYDIYGNLLPNPPESENPYERPIARPLKPPQPKISIADAFGSAWEDDSEQQDWLRRWDIQPANDARYLPDFPNENDSSTGADIRRGWHNSYKDFAKSTIGQYAPMFAEKMPQPQPQQSYGDFMGEIKNTASTLMNSAASQLGSGLGSALSFIPGLGPIMELIGQGANIASTVAGATGLGGEKAGAALNLIGSVANGAAGGAATSGGTEEFGPPIPNAGGMFSGLRQNQPPSTTTPANPPFKPQPAPASSDGEGSWFKPLDQMFKEIDERQARGETFDDKNNVWVKPATATGFASMPQEKKFGQAAQDDESPWIEGDVGNITQPINDRAKDEIYKYTPNVSVDENGRLQTKYDYSLDDPKFKEDLLNVLAEHEGLESKPYVPNKGVGDKFKNSGATLGAGSDFSKMYQSDIEKFGKDHGYNQDVIDDLKKFGKLDQNTKAPTGVAAQKMVDDFMQKHPDFELKPDQMRDLFDRRMQEFTPSADNIRKQMQAQGKDLSPEQYIGLVSGAYVKGAGGFEKSSGYQALQRGNWSDATRQAIKNDPSLAGDRGGKIADLIFGKGSFEESRRAGENKWKKAQEKYNNKTTPGYIQNPYAFRKP